MADMVEVITMHSPKTATNAHLREDIRELERCIRERKSELDTRKARETAATERYPDSRIIEKKQRYDPYARTRAQVYATGNRWAIENFEATHS